MHHPSISATLVRLFAVGLIFYAFRNAQMTTYFFSEGASTINIYMLLSGIAAPVIVAGFLWIAPNKVVGLSSAPLSENRVSNLNASSIFGAGVALMGLYFAVTAFAFIFDWYLSYEAQKNWAGEYSYTPSSDYTELYSEVVLLIIGLLLFFGSSAVAKLFSVARNFGVESARSPNKRFNRTPRRSEAAEPDESGGGAG